jgi:hypothetical protein
MTGLLAGAEFWFGLACLIGYGVLKLNYRYRLEQLRPAQDAGIPAKPVDLATCSDHHGQATLSDAEIERAVDSFRLELDSWSV